MDIRIEKAGVIIRQKNELTVTSWHSCYMQAGMSIAYWIPAADRTHVHLLSIKVLRALQTWSGRLCRLCERISKIYMFITTVVDYFGEHSRLC